MNKTVDRGQQVREDMMREIINYFIVHGYAPSVAELAKAVGLRSASTVTHHLDILIREGRLSTDAGLGSPRAFRVNGMRMIFVDGGKE